MTITITEPGIAPNRLFAGMCCTCSTKFTFRLKDVEEHTRSSADRYMHLNCPLQGCGERLAIPLSFAVKYAPKG